MNVIITTITKRTDEHERFAVIQMFYLSFKNNDFILKNEFKI